MRSRKFDLVFFSTTEFLLHALGPLWKARHGVPFCMDYQDPWVNTYYHTHPEVRPPGGRIKYGIIHQLHRMAERIVAPKVSGYLAVSATYLQDLDARYGERVRTIPRRVMPFPGEPAEFATVRSECCDSGTTAKSFTWRYVGRAGGDMERAIRIFFGGWQLAASSRSALALAMRLETFGTTYAAASHKAFKATIAPFAKDYALEDQVAEQPGRISYREMLGKLTSADGLVVFGSDDASYTASKLYPYLLAKRPLLVICHEQSSIVDVMRTTGGGTCVTFGASDDRVAVARVADHLAQQPVVQQLDERAFYPHTAKSQADTLARWIKAEVLASAPAA